MNSMLRTTLTRNLAFASRAAMSTRAAPFCIQRVCEFSSTAASHHPRAHKKTAKKGDDTSVETTAATAATTTKRHEDNQTAMRRSPWDAFFRSHSGFDDWMFPHHRDAFFPSFFQHDPLLEPMRQDVMNLTTNMPVVSFRGPASGNTNNSRLVRASPGYEIKESEENYEIVLDIPQGLEQKDLKVELERDGTIVHISGEHRREETSSDDQTTTVVTTRFSKRSKICASRCRRFGSDWLVAY